MKRGMNGLTSPEKMDRCHLTTCPYAGAKKTLISSHTPFVPLRISSTRRAFSLIGSNSTSIPICGRRSPCSSGHIWRNECCSRLSLPFLFHSPLMRGARRICAHILLLFLNEKGKKSPCHF